MKVPADLTTVSAGRLADMLLELRNERLDITAQADAIAAEERRIKDFLINTMPKAELQRISGKIANATLQRTIIARVTDWDAFYKFIGKKKAFDLLQRRPATPACRERWDQGVTIDGVQQDYALDINVTKLKG